MKQKVERMVDRIMLLICFTVIITCGTVVGAIVFIPLCLWGLCKGLTIKEVTYAFWIAGFGKELTELLDYLREV